MERVGDEQVQGGKGTCELQASLAVTCSAATVLETWKPAPTPKGRTLDGPLPVQSHTGGSVSALPPVPRLSVNALVLHELSRFDKEP